MPSWVSGLSEKTLALGSSVNRGNPPGLSLLLLAVSEESQKPEYVLVPYEHRETDSNSIRAKPLSYMTRIE
jgi:hypothetical protein